jgi:enolase
MTLVSISEADKRKIIWNFMEELIENYQNAIENNIPICVLSNGLSEDDKISVIKQYAKETGYIRIKGDTVTLTKKGIREVGKPKHSWDAINHN